MKTEIRSFLLGFTVTVACLSIAGGLVPIVPPVANAQAAALGMV